MGAPYADPDSTGAVGTVYLLTDLYDFVGPTPPLPPTSASLLDGQYHGSVTDDEVGARLQAVGDLNDDDWDDLLMVAPGYDSDSVTDAGGAYILFGNGY